MEEDSSLNMQNNFNQQPKKGNKNIIVIIVVIVIIIVLIGAIIMINNKKEKNTSSASKSIETNTTKETTSKNESNKEEKDISGLRKSRFPVLADENRNNITDVIEKNVYKSYSMHVTLRVDNEEFDALESDLNKFEDKYNLTIYHFDFDNKDIIEKFGWGTECYIMFFNEEVTLEKAKEIFGEMRVFIRDNYEYNMTSSLCDSNGDAI